MSGFTRRDFLRSSLAVAAVSSIPTGLLSPRAFGVTTPPFIPYTADSFFRRRVTGAPVDTARTAAFKKFMATHPDQRAISWPKMNVNPSWATTFYLGKPTDPIWKLAGGNTGTTRLKIAQTQGFHMADNIADLFPTGTQDRPGVIVDPVFGYTIQFADAALTRSTRTITVSNAGIMWHKSNGLDHRNPRSNDSRNETSRGRVIDAQIIRPDLLTAAVANNGDLGHVLHVFFVETKSTDGVCHPMVTAESGKVGWGAEGERFAIRPDVNLAARGLTGGALAIAKTLQNYGGYLGDNSGSSTQLKGATGGYPGTNVTTDALKGKVSWADMVVVQKGWQG